MLVLAAKQDEQEPLAGCLVVVELDHLYYLILLIVLLLADFQAPLLLELYFVVLPDNFH